MNNIHSFTSMNTLLPTNFSTLIHFLRIFVSKVMTSVHYNYVMSSLIISPQYFFYLPLLLSSLNSSLVNLSYLRTDTYMCLLITDPNYLNITFCILSSTEGTIKTQHFKRTYIPTLIVISFYETIYMIQNHVRAHKFFSILRLYYPIQIYVLGQKRKE